MAITLNGDTGITTPTYGGADTSEYLVPVTQFKNRIINGAMVIDQRNAGASVTVNSSSEAFGLDRWRAVGQSTDGVFTVQRDTVVPAGFVNSAKITVTTADSSIGSTQNYLFMQRIEGFNTADLNWGTANAQTVTLSFWVRSSVTGTFGGAIRNDDGDYNYPFSYSISSANTYEFKTITITPPTTGTWKTTNATGIQVTFSLGSGSSLIGTANAWTTSNFFGVTGQTNLIATNGATFYITRVQFEVGSTATSFDYRPYGTELALCQRYFEKSYDIGTALATIENNGCEVFRASLTNPYQTVTYRVTKRAVPTFTTYNPTTGATGSWRDASASANLTTSASFQGDRSAAVDVTTTSGNRIQGHWIASAEL